MRIHCARCNRKISAKVSTCPHCGSYNQYTGVEKSTKVKESAEVNLKEKNNFFKKLLKMKIKKAYLLWLIISILIIVGNAIRICAFYMSYLLGIFTFEEYLHYNDIPIKGIFILGIISSIAALCFIAYDLFTSDEGKIIFESKLKKAKEQAIVLLRFIFEQSKYVYQKFVSEFVPPAEEEKNKSIHEKLVVLKELHEHELISEEEYAEKKKELLKSL